MVLLMEVSMTWNVAVVYYYNISSRCIDISRDSLYVMYSMKRNRVVFVERENKNTMKVLPVYLNLLILKSNLNNFLSFRIKAAQKPDLYDTAQGVSSLSRVTVEDVRNIWLHRLIAETGLPSYKVNIPNEIVYDMENILKEKIPRDGDKCIQFEDFLPTLVFLIK